jgi:hypothetical protein
MTWLLLAEARMLTISICWSVKWRKSSIFQTGTSLTRRRLSLQRRGLRK